MKTMHLVTDTYTVRVNDEEINAEFDAVAGYSVRIKAEWHNIKQFRPALPGLYLIRQRAGPFRRYMLRRWGGEEWNRIDTVRTCIIEFAGLSYTEHLNAKALEAGAAVPH